MSAKNFSSVEHRAFDNYCCALDRDTLRVSVATGKDVAKVTLVWGDPFSCGILGGDGRWTGESVEMVGAKELRERLWWSADVKPPFKRCRYYFKIIFSGDGEEYFFCEDGFHRADDFARLPFALSAFTFPWMNEADICETPDWAARTVWYQIFPARFRRAKNSPRDDRLSPWAPPGRQVTNEERYGGNLAGVEEALDYLRDLGVTGIYLTPVNESMSQHKYDTTDYLRVDDEFGDNAAMKSLVQKAHSLGMRVMLDGVFNHCGWNFFAWQDVLKNRRESKYKDWFVINDFDFEDIPRRNALSGKYFSFAFVDTMPKLNTSNPEVRDYFCAVCETWLREYDIDALRLDVANELSHKFCKELRERLRAIKKDFYIVGEIWHDAMPWLRGDEFDSVMNYPLQNALLDFALDESACAARLERDINRCLVAYPAQNERVLLNQMDSHDTMRLATKTKSEDTATQLLLLLFALPGSVCVFYGTEILLEGGYDPDCRRCMPWKEIERGDYGARIDFMKSLIRLRRAHSALRALDTSFQRDNSPGARRLVQIHKTSDDKKEKIFIALNFGKSDARLKICGAKILLARKFSDGVISPGGFVCAQE